VQRIVQRDVDADGAALRRRIDADDLAFERGAVARVDLGALTRDEVCSKYGIQYSLCYKLRKYAAAGGSLVEL